jgi:hypothetical protein
MLISLAEAQKEFKFSILFWTLFEAAQNGFEFALVVSWILQKLLNLGPEQMLRRLSSSVYVQNLNM